MNDPETPTDPKDIALDNGGDSNAVVRGKDAGIQSPTTSGGEDSEERTVSTTEDAITDAERLQVEGEVIEVDES